MTEPEISKLLANMVSAIDRLQHRVRRVMEGGGAKQCRGSGGALAQDVDCDGRIGYHEFMSSLMEWDKIATHHEDIWEDALRSVFAQLDVEGNGHVSLEGIAVRLPTNNCHVCEVGGRGCSLLPLSPAHVTPCMSTRIGCPEFRINAGCWVAAGRHAARRRSRP